MDAPEREFLRGGWDRRNYVRKEALLARTAGVEKHGRNRSAMGTPRRAFCSRLAFPL